MATKVFEVKLFQSYMRRVNTETFQVEAETEDEARNKVEKTIQKEREIEGDYDLEVRNTLQPEATNPLSVPNEPQTDVEGEDTGLDRGPVNDGAQPAVRPEEAVPYHSAQESNS